MKFSSFALASLSFFEATSSVTSFSPAKVHTSIIVTRRMGYLDDLAADLSAPDSNPIPAEEAREANVMSKDKIVGAGPGDWDSYVEFDEFDGGDGQMGVAGDGNKGLDKFDMSTIAKSKSMSGKNKIIESNQIKSNHTLVRVVIRRYTVLVFLNTSYLLTTLILKTIKFLFVSFFYCSRYNTAKNAWGTNTGYADTLIEQGVDTSRAQQLENW